MREWFANSSIDSSAYRALLVVIGASLFFAITSPYSAIDYLSLPARFLYWLITVTVAWFTFIACRLGALYLGKETQNVLFTLIASICATPLVLVTILSGQQLIGYPVPVEFWLTLLLSIWVICFVLACVYVWLNSYALVVKSSLNTQSSSETGTANSQLNGRLPAELRGSEIHALSADDHYVHIHTSAGKSMQLLKLKDAIAMMGDVAGTQVHRSWWVTNAAIKSVRASATKPTIQLVDGTIVPVSRSGLKRIKDQGLI